MPGDPDPIYVRARNALLDAADALAEHRDAVVLVGAQAVYLHTGEADFAVAEFTRDADFCLTPTDLKDRPLLQQELEAEGFSLGEQPGAWLSPDGIPVDLMVPEALAGPGSRGARLGPHGRRVARRAKGLEGAIVDRELMEISSLDPNVERSAAMLVAGPAALLVAKVHKIAERAGVPNRLNDKDAFDVFRLLQATDSPTLAEGLAQLMDHEVSQTVATEALSQLSPLFAAPDAVGVRMAVRAAGPDAEPDVIAASLRALVSDLVAATGGGGTARP